MSISSTRDTHSEMSLQDSMAEFAVHSITSMEFVRETLSVVPKDLLTK